MPSASMASVRSLGAAEAWLERPVENASSTAPRPATRHHACVCPRDDAAPLGAVKTTVCRAMRKPVAAKPTPASWSSQPHPHIVRLTMVPMSVGLNARSDPCIAYPWAARRSTSAALKLSVRPITRCHSSSLDAFDVWYRAAGSTPIPPLVRRTAVTRFPVHSGLPSHPLLRGVWVLHRVAIPPQIEVLTFLPRIFCQGRLAGPSAAAQTVHLQEVVPLEDALCAESLAASR